MGKWSWLVIILNNLEWVLKNIGFLHAIIIAWKRIIKIKNNLQHMYREKKDFSKYKIFQLQERMSFTFYVISYLCRCSQDPMPVVTPVAFSSLKSISMRRMTHWWTFRYKELYSNEIPDESNNSFMRPRAWERRQIIRYFRTRRFARLFRNLIADCHWVQRRDPTDMWQNVIRIGLQMVLNDWLGIFLRDAGVLVASYHSFRSRKHFRSLFFKEKPLELHNLLTRDNYFGCATYLQRHPIFHLG